MTESYAAADVREDALATLLRQPGLIVAATGSDAFRVPMPESIGFTEDRIAPLPTERATIVDLVVPADTMEAVTVWERALKRGLAVGTVRMRHTPDRSFSLTYLDMRHRHGVWIAMFAPIDDTATEPNALSSSLIIPLRPRTATMRKTWNAIITEIDPRTTALLGWSPEQMIGLRSLDFIHPDDQERALANWLEMLSRKDGQRVRLRHSRQDGGWLWVEIENVYEHPDGTDEVDGIVIHTQLNDISDELAAVEALDRREKLFRRLAESLPIGLLQVGLDGTPTYDNARLTEILGVHGATTLDEQLSTVVPRDRPAIDAAFAHVLAAGTDHELEIAVRVPQTGELRHCSVTLISLSDREGAPGALACVNDITESATMREELKAKATFDALTGCYNRASTMDLLDHELAVGGDHITGAIYIDLDNFKPVNDTLGHAAGDELLVHTAQRLAELLRDDDDVGRLGGDEFLVVCRRIEGPEAACAIARRVYAALTGQVELTHGVVEVGASVGVACSRPGSTSDTLVAEADAAMYECKQGKPGPVLFGEARERTGEARERTGG